MKIHDVRTHPSAAPFPREEELAWKLAMVAADPVPLDADVAEMIGNRIVDNASVAMAAINRAPVVAARAQALAHPPRRWCNAVRIARRYPSRCGMGRVCQRRCGARTGLQRHVPRRPISPIPRDCIRAAAGRRPADRAATGAGAAPRHRRRPTRSTSRWRRAIAPALPTRSITSSPTWRRRRLRGPGRPAGAARQTRSISAFNPALHLSFAPRASPARVEISSWKADAPAGAFGQDRPSRPPTAPCAAQAGPAPDL